MNKKDEIKMEILSNIDDDVIEKQTQKRYRLLLKNRYSRKKMMGWISAAVCLLLAFTLLLPFLQKQVPVYEGMTVSNERQSDQLLADISRWSLASQEELSHAMREVRVLSNGEDHIPALSDAADTAADNRLPDSADLLGENRSLYYAQPKQDIYITIHLNNPENYEILSFTLNGTKYQAFMFEDGSDSENLILKVNVGDAQGMVEYTIDAIKYVDGTKIKDVRMEGDRTVRVGVYPKDQPVATIEAQNVLHESMTWQVTYTDPLSLIKESDGRMKLYVYQGETKVLEKEITGENPAQIPMSGLIPGARYDCQVVAQYDALDGKGFGAYVIGEQSVTLKSHVEISNLQVTALQNISFELNTEDSVVIQKIELLNENGVAERSGDSTVREFTGLAIGNFTLRVTYTYEMDGTKTGYVYSGETLRVDKMGSLWNVVPMGEVIKGYSPETQIYNATTEDYRQHYGIDVVVAEGASEKSVFAAFSGKITEVSGSKVVLTSFDGSVQLTYESLTNITALVGDSVLVGDTLGEVSSTLAIEQNDPPHLHLELRIQGELMDPMQYFE